MLIVRVNGATANEKMDSFGCCEDVLCKESDWDAMYEDRSEWWLWLCTLLEDDNEEFVDDCLSGVDDRNGCSSDIKVFTARSKSHFDSIRTAMRMSRSSMSAISFRELTDVCWSAVNSMIVKLSFTDLHILS